MESTLRRYGIITLLFGGLHCDKDLNNIHKEKVEHPLLK